VLIKKEKKFMWNRVEREMYKMDGGSFKGCSRVELIGKRGESTNFHVRYFEVAPGGWTTLEHHQHEHVVVIVRGSGYIQLGSEAYAMHVGDVGYTAPGDVHQLRCAEEATDNFGFICIVSAERDRPIEVDASEHLIYCESVSGNHLEDAIRKSLQAQAKHRAAQEKLKNPDGSYAEGSACEWRPPGKK
jgi:ribulose-bisphosphate carboxylase large chain